MDIHTTFYNLELIMKKICILTSFTDKILYDDYGKCDYCNLSSKNHNEYSFKHNYTFIKEIVRNEDYLDWHPTWIKIDVIRKYLPLFDYLVWIDSDAVFVDQNMTIESLLFEDTDLVIPKLEFDQVGGQQWTKTTTGFMIWKNSHWSNETLQYLWDVPNEFRWEFFHEQSRLDEILIKKFESLGAENIIDYDLSLPVKIKNIVLLPYSFHRYFDDDVIKYVFHAGGDTGTKTERLEKVLGL